MVIAKDSTVALLRSDPKLLFDSDFNNGLSGFVQLTDHTQPIGLLGLDTERTHGNSRYSMLLSTEDQPWGKTPAWQWSSTTAIKRIQRPDIGGRIKLDVWWTFRGIWGQNAPRAVRFGIDQSDRLGARHYFMLQYMNYDDLLAARVQKFQVLTDQTATGGATKTFIDIPSGVQDLGYNENKGGEWHTECVYDLDSYVYDGVRVNGNGLGGGSLASGVGMPSSTVSSNPLRSLGSPLLESIPTGNIDSFNSGLNICIDLVNRQNTFSSKGLMNVTRVRLEQL